MKKNLFTAFFVAALFVSFSAKANVDAAQAQAFVEKVTKEGIEEIINANVSQTVKDERFEKLFNNALDLNFIGQFVLGRYWKTSSVEQKKAFINAYRQLNIQTWSQRFDEFKGKSFVFQGTSPSNSASQIFVNSTVPMNQGEPAKVIWRVKQTGDSFKIVDIIIENVSLAITARNEYTAYVKSAPNGVDDLIKDLLSKTRKS